MSGSAASAEEGRIRGKFNLGSPFYLTTPGRAAVAANPNSSETVAAQGKKEALELKPWVRLAVAGVSVGGMIGLLAYGFTRDARYIQSPLVAEQAPSFTLTLFDGKVIRLEDFRGKAVLVNFWASWCVPCRAEAVALENAWQKYKDRGVVFVGVNIQDKETDARAFMKEFGISYLNGRDESGKIAIDYGVWGIPETFFIDPQGRITYKHAGELKAPIIESKLDEALKGIVSAEGKGEYRSVR